MCIILSVGSCVAKSEFGTGETENENYSVYTVLHAGYTVKWSLVLSVISSPKRVVLYLKTGGFSGSRNLYSLTSQGRTVISIGKSTKMVGYS